MKPSWPRAFVVALLPALALAVGCRNRGAQELLERDLRRQEDQIYALECKLAQCQAVLNAQGCDPAASPAYGSPAMEGTIRTAPPTRLEELPQRGSYNGGRTPGPGGLAPPTIELPSEQAPPFRAPPEIQPPNPDIPEGELPRSRYPNSSAVPNPSPLPDLKIGNASQKTVVEPEAPKGPPGEVMGIAINPRVTGGFASDNRPGADGVTVLIEPLDADGRPTEVPGQLSIVVMDPSLAGESSRIARWDFTADEIAPRWRSTPDGKGWRFDLRWPSAAPQNNRLVVNARYLKNDGSKLDAEGVIDVELPPVGPAVRRQQPPWPTGQSLPGGQWTRATRPWPRAPGYVPTAPMPMQPSPMQQNPVPTIPMVAGPMPGYPDGMSDEGPRVLLSDPDGSAGADDGPSRTVTRPWSPYR